MSNEVALRRRDLIRYSILALPIAFAGMPLYIHAPDFYVTNYGLSLSLIATMLLALRLIDAIQDPFIGWFSDRFAHRRVAIIVVGAILLVASFTALFSPSFSPPTWFLVSMLLATFAFSVLGINLFTIGGIWSKDSYQKTRITVWRETVTLVGLLIAVMLPSVLQQSMPAKEAFGYVGLLLGTLTLLAIALFMSWCRTEPHVTRRSNRKHVPVWRVFAALPGQTRRFFAVYGVSMLASSIPALLILFFVRDRLNAEAYTGMFLALYFLAGAACMPVWQALSKQYDKLLAWGLSMVFAVMVFVWAFFLGEGDVWQFAAICVISGAAFGADLALPPSILADHIQNNDQGHQAATQFSILPFLLKSSLALASFATFPVLEYYGFVPGGDNSNTALVSLSAAYALIPCAIKLIAIGMLWHSYHIMKQGGQDETHRHASGGRAYAR